MMNKKTVLVAGSALLLALAVTGGFMYQSDAANASAEASAAPPPPPVSVQVMTKQPVQIWQEFSARLRPVDYVELRPQVSGSLTEIRFVDGQIVNKDDIVLVIDPRPFEAAVAQATAALQAAKNQATLAQKEYVRAGGLIKTGAIPRRLYDEKQSAAQVAKAQVDAAQAQLNQAQIDLDHAYVKAPITGRISRAELTIGNVVQAGPNAPILTTIASNDGIYADFEVDEKTYLKSVYNKARDRESQTKIPVQLVLKSDESITRQGVIESFDNHIDTATGSIRARARFDNTDSTLMPGMSVSIRMGNSSPEAQLMVPEPAVGTDQNRKFVYVVDAGKKVVYREVKLGASVDGRRVVTDGLKEGEMVITEGTMKIRPDMVVTPKPQADVAIVP